MDPAPWNPKWARPAAARYRMAPIAMAHEKPPTMATATALTDYGVRLIPLGPFPTGTVATTFRSFTSRTDTEFA